MENNNKKLNDILDAARELFWKHGFKRVSIEEICKKAKVSKMTYYRFFPNKIELAKTVYSMVMDKGIEQFREIMSSDLTSSEKIKKLVMLKMEGTNDISREFLNDFYNNPELGLKDFLEQKMKDTLNITLNEIRYAQHKGWFRPDFKPEIMFFIWEKFSELMFDERFSGLYAQPKDMIMEITNFVAYGISAHE